MKGDEKLSVWERYLTKEIGIEFKSCLYFFAILFYYCVFRIVTGRLDAGIVHMAEMIFACYIIGYVQVLVFKNFDEADCLGRIEWLGLTVCTLFYGALSFALNWFDRNLYVSLGFTAYVFVTYLCVVVIYRSKRRIDDKKLNEDLMIFRTEHKKVHDKDE